MQTSSRIFWNSIQRIYPEFLREGGISPDTNPSESFPPGLAPIALHLELAIYSDWIVPHDPISLLIIAPVGAGKTELLRAYSANRGLILFNDFTAAGLYKLASQLQSGAIKRILVADLLRLTARGAPIRREIMATLNALIEEGLEHIQTGFFSIHFDKPLRAGIIAGLTVDEWNLRREHWARIGFLSRALPVSYLLAPEDIQRGEKLIYSDQVRFPPIKLKLPSKPMKVELTAEAEQELYKLGLKVAAMNRDETRFRTHRHLISLAKAAALRAGRRKVAMQDVNLLKALSIFWISPHTGDEPSYRILLQLQSQPATTDQLVQGLAGLYSRATIYRRLEYLEKLGAISKDSGKWIVS